MNPDDLHHHLYQSILKARVSAVHDFGVPPVIHGLTTPEVATLLQSAFFSPEGNALLTNTFIFSDVPFKIDNRPGPAGTKLWWQLTLQLNPV